MTELTLEIRRAIHKAQYKGGLKNVKNIFDALIKRVFDITASIIGLILSSPLAIIVYVLIKSDSPGNVIFKQRRVGKNGKIFKMLKFRSMRKDAEEKTGPTWAVEGDSRVTRVGKFLRKTRLDELPQLVNVLSGDMSLVGPRPERPHFVEKFRKEIPNYDLRHSVKPGITGEAQIFNGYDTSFKDVMRKIQYDLSYLKNKSIYYDIRLMYLTISVIFTGRGAQ